MNLPEILLNVFLWVILLIILIYVPSAFVDNDKGSLLYKIRSTIRDRLGTAGNYVMDHLFYLIGFCIVGSLLSMVIFVILQKQG